MSHTQDPAIAYRKAIEIALSYIDTRPGGTDYNREVAVIHDRGAYWGCLFLKKQPAHNSEDIIAVHKITGKVCSWSGA